MTDGAPDGAPDGAHGAPERSERGKGHGPGATDPFQTPTRPVRAWTAPAPPASKRPKYIARLDMTDGAPDGAPEPGGGHLGPVSTVLFETPTRPVRIRVPPLPAPPAPRRPLYIARPGPIEVTCVEMGPLVSALKLPGGDVEDLIGATIGYLLATPMAYRSAPMKWVEAARSLFALGWRRAFTNIK